MSVAERTCDLCGNTIKGKKYVTLTWKNMEFPIDPKIDDVCEKCLNKIRSYIRHGLPKIREIESTDVKSLEDIAWKQSATVHKAIEVPDNSKNLNLTNIKAI